MSVQGRMSATPGDGKARAPGGAEARDKPGADERVPPVVRKLLERFPLLKREPHLVTIHFALVFPMAVPLFNILYLLRPKREAFEKTAFYMLALGALAAPVAICTGLFTWWLNFKARPTGPIKVKIAVSLALEADLLVLLVWRLGDEEIMRVSSRSRLIYFALSLVMPALTTVLGHVGGRLSGHR